MAVRIWSDAPVSSRVCRSTSSSSHSTPRLVRCEDEKSMRTARSLRPGRRTDIRSAGPDIAIGRSEMPEHRADVFLDPADDPREGGPTLGDERTTLVEYLRFQRLTLQVKCSEL